MKLRRTFRGLLSGLFVTSLWATYANVLSDDAAVRVKARLAANEAAGCFDACKLEGMRGDRGILEERIEYDIANKGHYVVVCRRAFIVAGEYDCTVTERPAGAPPRAK